MAWGAALAAGLSIANQYLGSANSKKSYHYQSNLLNKQNDYATKVMLNAHQYEKQDLLNAGLNPLLTVTGGSGASASGVTSAPSVQKADTPDLSRIVASAIEAKNLENNTKTTEAAVKKAEAETKNIEADTVNKGLDRDYKQLINSWLPKEMKAKITNWYADSKLKSFMSNTLQAKKLQSEIDKNRAEEKYTNEKSRNTNIFDAVGTTGHRFIEGITGKKWQKPWY